ncbi:unnamed protein product [Arabis nemorensis]|uniref:Uncharacterized protein n=1 Tax=Arabis nemorensis TaxID=586526 RepID=A0A565ASV4_9BRAS|nr:unnamed protein product [Arabis nemorensis]
MGFHLHFVITLLLLTETESQMQTTGSLPLRNIITPLKQLTIVVMAFLLRVLKTDHKDLSHLTRHLQIHLES